MNAEEIGKLIAETRQEKGYTYRDAQEIGMCVEMVRRAISMTEKVTLKHLITIMDWLDLEIVVKKKEK